MTEQKPTSILSASLATALLITSATAVYFWQKYESLRAELDARPAATVALQASPQRDDKNTRPQSPNLLTGTGAPLPVMPPRPIPENASPALKELLKLQAQMREEQTKAMNEQREAKPEEREAMQRAWQEKNQQLQTALRAQSSVVAAESRKNPLPLPPPPNIPDSASPELRESILKRYAQTKEYVEKENQLRSLPPEQQEAARRASRPPAPVSPAGGIVQPITPPPQSLPPDNSKPAQP